MKTMVIGLSPEYNYPGSIEKLTESTFYASNFGASLISHAILKQFNADYIPITEFSKIDELRSKYDICILAFSTHISPWRNVSVYDEFVRKLNIKTIILSLGIQDYYLTNNEVATLHPSMLSLLKFVSTKSKYIGVRGNYSASVLYKHGFKNVVPIGCPTLYHNLDVLQVDKKNKFSKPLIAYHKTFATEGLSFLKDFPILGQDYQDEVIFTNNLDDDHKNKEKEDSFYNNLSNKDNVLDAIKQNGIFPQSFSDWFNIIGKHDFIIGARLHASICALLQNIPAVLIARDLRMIEIAEFYNIPYNTFDDIKNNTIEQLYDKLDYSKFNETIKVRFENYLKFIKENDIPSAFQVESTIPEFKLTNDDYRINLMLLNSNYWNFYMQYKNSFSEKLVRKMKKVPIIKRLLRKYI